MECNKDEATRAKEIAENKFTAKDIFGARNFALKAQNLFPGLEGIHQMLTTLNVYVSAYNKINGEADWYGILGVDPLADDDTVRKQYRKLALLLHPDKNNSIGADGAFNLISEAWSSLSDKAKRVAYNQKINVKARKVSTSCVGSYNLAKTTASTPSHNSKPDSFWTVCHGCKVRYEYLRVYLNRRLTCPNCKEAFLAVEKALPVSGIKLRVRHHPVSAESKSNAKKNTATPNVGAGSYSKTDSYNVQGFPFSTTTAISFVAQVTNVVQHAYGRVKRERQEAQEIRKREEHVAKNSYFVPIKKRRSMMQDTSLNSHGCNQTGYWNCEVGASNSYKSKEGDFVSNWIKMIMKTSSAKDVSHDGIQNLPVEEAIKEISKKLGEIQDVSQDEIQNLPMEEAVKEISKKLSEIKTNAAGESPVEEMEE